MSKIFKTLDFLVNLTIEVKSVFVVYIKKDIECWKLLISCLD